jgi:hypothetical protein
MIMFNSLEELMYYVNAAYPIAIVTAKEVIRELGRRGGRSRNPRKGFGSLSKKRRREVAQKAAQARWSAKGIG